MGQNIEIELDDPTKLYSMHDTLKGTVKANFAKEIDVIDIAVKLKCISCVDIIYGNNYHDIKTQKYFQIILTVFPPPELAAAVRQKVYTLGAGHYEWPFVIDLSPYAGLSLPPTSHGVGVLCDYKVEYTYKAVVHRESHWKRNLRACHPFKLYPCIDVELIEYSQRRQLHSELVFNQLVPGAKAAHFYSRIPRLPNKIFAELEFSEVIPQLPRKMGLALRVRAEKEFAVKEIKCFIKQYLFLTAQWNKRTVVDRISCGQKTLDLSGTEINLTEFVSDFSCEAIQAYDAGILNCRHELNLIITLRDPAAKNRTAKISIETPVSIATSHVHRHNAPVYQEDNNKIGLPQKSSSKSEDKLKPSPHVDLHDAPHTQP
ncbi:hypothetical protein B9G98_04386 [Wickerhamiella sorbophila]|uniref:Arrestin-like N-terminal domain-containing protein n=1 Tax=Wickerhamiella sorbophila TaxID=45607 RepID=A0A2T0FP51_9ASCO|nr:hypothetical protein B9G98_04386 [Wickerhamiella sorbophila]PRT56766.1 hypothetical protein B9G98_04386 [Wickerhamiella sorbophila]